MKVIFVIGGIGSGKSTVTRLFGSLGSPTLDLDRVGHQVLLAASVKDELVDAFGMDIIDEDGQIVRSSLAARAFASPQSTAVLSGITAPYITRELTDWIGEREREGCTSAVVEVSAYDGSTEHYAGIADEVVAVVAPAEKRVKRAVSNGFDAEDVRQRIARQPSDESRRTWADYVIENDGTPEQLQSRVEEVWTSVNG